MFSKVKIVSLIMILLGLHFLISINALARDLTEAEKNSVRLVAAYLDTWIDDQYYKNLSNYIRQKLDENELQVGACPIPGSGHGQACYVPLTAKIWFVEIPPDLTTDFCSPGYRDFLEFLGIVVHEASHGILFVAKFVGFIFMIEHTIVYELQFKAWLLIAMNVEIFQKDKICTGTKETIPSVVWNRVIDLIKTYCTIAGGFLIPSCKSEFLKALEARGFCDFWNFYASQIATSKDNFLDKLAEAIVFWNENIERAGGDPKKAAELLSPAISRFMDAQTILSNIRLSVEILIKRVSKQHETIGNLLKNLEEKFRLLTNAFGLLVSNLQIAVERFAAGDRDGGNKFIELANENFRLFQSIWSDVWEKTWLSIVKEGNRLCQGKK